MKLGEDVLLEVMNALQKGLIEQVDISELLRQIDVSTDLLDNKLHLTKEYVEMRAKADANL